MPWRPLPDAETKKKSRLAVVGRKTHQFGIVFYTDELHWSK
jgi:hypothetical protein